jgi:hypothetical protein
MRGLPFPQDAAFERETSYEYGTPASNFDEIPIDPALADPPIDPALQLYPIKLDPDQVRVRLYTARDATFGLWLWRSPTNRPRRVTSLFLNA